MTALLQHLEDTGTFWLYALAMYGLIVVPLIWYAPQAMGQVPPPGRREKTFGVRYGCFTTGIYSLAVAIHLTLGPDVGVIPSPHDWGPLWVLLFGGPVGFLVITHWLLPESAR